ncbi:unnamed protein product [Phytomonas sp. EM1]|nr:unnamed protein product [Phytomonas sp. EM1]|eukprot:CCW60323.1 unnamed protein product [Phytomonas sp. isolate EM1]
MSNDEVVKILLLGPPKSGKSTIANFLGMERDNPSNRYYETKPLRIIETYLDVESIKLDNRRVVFAGSDSKTKRVRVQLWDLGGSPKNQPCWPAVADKADGIIFVFNPEIKNSSKELSLWYKNFALNLNEIDELGKSVHRVRDEHCLIFAHHSTNPQRDVGESVIPHMPQGMEGIKTLETSLDYHSENFKYAFDKLLESIVVARMGAEEDELLRQERESSDQPHFVY